MKPKIKLIAVAKDEAAYLPEWIFHHKYFGFDYIHVFVNRTTDNSAQTLDWLCDEFEGVSYSNLDWIDTCPQEAQFQLQYIAYASAFDEAKRSDDIDYVMFLDIDEFWTPKSMVTTIQDVVLKYPRSDAISFQWINEFGSENSFQPLAPVINGRINPLVKTVINTKATVLTHGYHKPTLAEGSKHIMMDGTRFESSETLREGLVNDLTHLRPAMVIHRLFRSPLEYVSLLHRGRPSDDIQLKLNRGGYNYVMGREVEFPYNKANYEAYRQKRQAFFDDESLNELLTVSRKFVKGRYDASLDSVKNVPLRYIAAVAKIFRGCSQKEIDIILASLRTRVNQSKMKVEKLLELAGEAEKYNTDIALILYERALSIRPHGPKINEKIRKLQAAEQSGE